jgi:hypothetical protein
MSDPHLQHHDSLTAKMELAMGVILKTNYINTIINPLKKQNILIFFNNEHHKSNKNLSLMNIRVVTPKKKIGLRDLSYYKTHITTNTIYNIKRKKSF